MRLSKGGYSMVEVMIVVLIVTTILAGGFLIFSTGQSTWFTSDIKIRLEENIRQALEKITTELRQSRVDQSQVFDNTGPNNTDVVRFSVPVVCEAGGNLIDINGDVAHWGAPLTWGCTSSTCMDADNDCDTVDYQFVEYGLGSDDQLVRRVLDATPSVVRTDVVAQGISDFQVQVNGSVVTLTLQAQQVTVTNRTMSESMTTAIYLRN